MAEGEEIRVKERESGEESDYGSEEEESEEEDRRGQKKKGKGKRGKR